MLQQGSINKGIALVEVLITTVITAVGTLAVVLLLNNLIASSSISKARDEALSLAQSKIELFHNNMNKAQYQAIKSGNDGPIKGFNALFSLSWEVKDAKNPDRKIIKVIVSWDDNKTESIQLNTIINWNDPHKSASIASYGVDTGFLYLSPNQIAKRGEQYEITLPKDAKVEALPYQMKKYTDNQANIFILDENNHLLLTIYPTIEKKERDLLQISGYIYYQGNIQTDLKVSASGGAYCLFPLESKKIADNLWQMAKYYCISAKGWRGKIGVLTTRNINQLNYCPDRNREYLAYSLNNGKKLYQSGLKFNYLNQDFIIGKSISSHANDLSCQNEINQLQQLIDKSSFKSAINAENHTIMEMDKVYSLSGSVKFPEQMKVSRFHLSIANRKHDCRLLNQLDHINDSYSCAVEPKNSTELPWNGEIKGVIYTGSSKQVACDFELAFENQHKPAILDIDLSLLCQ